MKFFTRRRRQPPAIIIVSLIDVLIVLLIFLVTTTTFRQQPAVQLTLPQSKQAKKGSSEASLVITVTKKAPFFFVGQKSMTTNAIKDELRAAYVKNPSVTLGIRADTETPFGNVLLIRDMAFDAHITNQFVFTQPNVSP